MDLDKYIEDHLNKPFNWGKNDCMTFTNGAVETVTGINHLKKIRKWRDPKEAKKVLKKEKHKEFVDIFDSRFRQHKNSNKLKDGDIALADVADDKSFSKLSALIYYKGKLVGIGKNGLETYPVDSGKFFFNVRSLRIRG